jgi:hypothetical protein
MSDKKSAIAGYYKNKAAGRKSAMAAKAKATKYNDVPF